MKKNSLVTVSIMLASFYSQLSLAKQHEISQKDKKFSQTEITVKIGDEIKFVNADNTTHHLMYKIDGKRFSKKQKDGDPEGSALIQKFNKKEELTIRCAIHPKMKLKVKVE